MDRKDLPHEKFREKFIEFILDAKVDGDCPACKSSSWNIIGLPPDGMESGISLNAETFDTSKQSTMKYFIPVVTMMCQQCGFMRMHALHPFDQWLSKTDGKDNE